MNTTRQTLVDIYHPTFREGYQEGRKHYFQEPSTFTDKHLVDCLQVIFEKEEGEEREHNLYYSIGHLVGLISGNTIPRQVHEDNTQKLQEEFLVKVMEEYGAAGKALSDTIRHFWNMQDQLAQTLDADNFELMLTRGV